MQIQLRVLLSLFSSLSILTILNAQFNQNLDSLNLNIEYDSTENLIISSGLHHSFHRVDEKVYQSDKDFLSVVDATRMMQTQTTGLHVNANAFTPGASSSTILRGYRSFLGVNEPLIILDGMPIDNSDWGSGIGGVDQSNRLIDINPNNIESIELIKSAAGRAKYGIVGGNGVILINSKKGIINKPKITVRTSLTIDQLSAMPALQNTFAQGRQINGERVYRGPETGEGFSWGPLISDLDYDGDNNYSFDKNGRLVAAGTGNGMSANTYDASEFFQNGISNNINADIKGGSELLQYFVSAGYNNQQGVIPKNKFTRYNAFANLGYNPSNKLEINGNITITQSNSNRSQRGSNVKGIMLGLLRSSPSFDNSNNNSDPVNDLSTYELANGNQRSYRSGIYDNPYWTINKNIFEDNVTRNIINLSANYSLLQNVDFRFAYGNDQYTDERKGGIDINPGRDVGSAFQNKISHNSQNIDASIIHQSDLSDGFKINTSAGINYNMISRGFDIQNTTELLSSNNLSITNGTNFNASFNELDRKRFGIYLFADGSYKDFVNISINLRQDYSNHFGTDTNGFLSYGLGASMVLNNFLFDLNSATSPKLVLHGSIGKFGNDITEGFNTSKFTSTASISGDGFINAVTIDSPELSISGLNKSLTAETNESLDIGIDFESANEQFQFGILIYKEESSGLLLQRQTAFSSGISNIIENVGAIENQGIEVSFGANLIHTKKYKWNSSLAFSKNTNKVVATNGFEEIINLNGFTGTRTAAIVGEQYGVLVGSGFLLNENNQLIIDNEGFPFSEQDILVGNPNPDWTMFINNRISINDKINITAEIDIKSGGDIWCGTCGILDYFGRSSLAASEVGQSLFFEGVTTAGQSNTVEAQLAPSDGNSSDFYRLRYGFGGLSEMSVFDASWIRLRTISLDYNVSELFKISSIHDFTIGIFAKNLVVISEYPGIDPETSLTGNNGPRGIDYFNNPGSRQIGAKINLSF